VTSGDPDRAAILGPGFPPLSYADLAEQVSATAAELSELGVGRQDRVALVLPNGPAMAIDLLGVMATGIAAPLNPQYTAEELRFFFADLRPSLVIIDEALDTPAREVATSVGVAIRGRSTDALDPAGRDVVEARPDDVALLLHTSGTTSRPKLVPLTHANLVASARNVAGALDLRSTDRCFNVMPLFHIHGIVAALLATLASDGSVICTPGFRASHAVPWMQDFRPTWYTAVPTLHRALLDAVTEGTWRPPLRFARSSSAALPTPLRAELEREFAVPVIEAYGMTEAAHQIASGRVGDASTPGSVGRAAGPEIAIVDDAGNRLPVGRPGEIVIRGSNVMTGYLDNPDANAAAFVDGWFRTGDEGKLATDGSLTITGRLKEIINRGGEKVAPTEVEEVLLSHPDVSDAAVFGVPHPTLGEEVGAVVALRADASVTAGALRQFVAEQLAPFKVPRRFVFAPAIPKGPTGKVQRVGMAAVLGIEGPPRDRDAFDIVEPRDDTERRIVAMFADVLKLDAASVSVTDDFVELGADSLHLVELVSEIEREFGKEVPAAIFLTGATPAHVADFVRGDSEDVAAIVRIQPAGSRPPLFCVMRAATLVTLRHFVPALGPDQPIYGIWMPAMHGNTEAAGGIEDIATTCRRAIAETGADAPYYLFGYSLGGLVTYEMARQWSAEGESVGLVIMADTPCPVPYPTRRDQVRKLFSREGPRAVARRVGGAVDRVVHRREIQAQAAERRRALIEQFGPSVDLDAALRREREYIAAPRPPGAPVVLLRTRVAMDHWGGGSPALGWDRYVRDDWELREVPGSHESMIGEPHVHVLAAAVAESLRRAQQSPPAS
jgi:acyl carrier protein